VGGGRQEPTAGESAGPGYAVEPCPHERDAHACSTSKPLYGQPRY